MVTILDFEEKFPSNYKYFSFYGANIRINPIFELSNEEIVASLDKAIKLNSKETKHIKSLLIAFEIFEYLYYTDEQIINRIKNEFEKEIIFKEIEDLSFEDARSKSNYVFCRKLTSFKELLLFTKKENIEELKFYLNHLPDLDSKKSYKKIQQKFTYVMKNLIEEDFEKLYCYFKIFSFFFPFHINEMVINGADLLILSTKHKIQDAFNTLITYNQEFNKTAENFEFNIDVNHKQKETIDWKIQNFIRCKE